MRVINITATVFEAGDSESLDELPADMRWWFATSEHDVKIALLAKFDHRRHKIILENCRDFLTTPIPKR